MLSAFHPAVRDWFQNELGEPTEVQKRAFPLIRAGRDTLIAAPTGSGKTLAAFLCAIDELVRESEAGTLTDETRVLYVSPLKALSNDIEKNLNVPLGAIEARLAASGTVVPIRAVVRTGDTKSSVRAKMARVPPHILVTTPESLFILLTSVSGRKMLETVRSVIVDEVHALTGNKRGSHLSLSLERLSALVRGPLVRIGLSATQRPLERVARFLVGSTPDDVAPACEVVDMGHLRELDLEIEVPRSPLEAVMAEEVWQETYDRVADLVREHRTTLVFVNQRRLAERACRHLGERLGEDQVAAHHGSLSREQRLDAEQRLKGGQLRALVCTASLELGIDVGEVELVCQLGSTTSIAALLQRVGRAGHWLGRIPKGRLFPLSRDQLVECLALVDCVRRHELDELHVVDKPLDILAQQIVAIAAAQDIDEDALFALVTAAYPYRALQRAEFEQILDMLEKGFTTRRGRRGARIHRDRVGKRVRGRRGAGLLAMTSGGAIPDNADYDVMLEPSGQRVGSINEDFAIESMAGDIFQLGNASWRILRVEPGLVRVEDARGLPPTLPFWLGEAPSRSRELSAAVSRIRVQVERHLPTGQRPTALEVERGVERAVMDLKRTVGVGRAAINQAVEYLAAGCLALGAMPSQETIVIERFFDDSGGMQLVVHSPFGSRLNRAWGLSLRKRFCQRFDFELQAAATEDAIVLSLGQTHSFELRNVFDYLRAETVRDLLIQALLVAPMFATRWRWNAGRALAVPRFRGGKKVPPRFQRMDADDLLTFVFPDSTACFENIQGAREVPDHPLVVQTVGDCLTEAMDIDAFEDLLRQITGGHKRLVAIDTREPSPLAAEILTAKPYAFLDDAPLEERRTQAVASRRYLDPATAADLGAFDADAIGRVAQEAWPDPQNRDELHDALVLLGFVTGEEVERYAWGSLMDELVAERRATCATIPGHDRQTWVSVERLGDFKAVHPEATLSPALPLLDPPGEHDMAVVELLRGRLESIGIVTAAELAHSALLDGGRVDTALAALESEGFVLRGSFTPGLTRPEWCERRLLARITRYTLGRLRAEIEPVTTGDYMRFLFSWHGVEAGPGREGSAAVATALEQLVGCELPAAVWEAEVLPARIRDYEPGYLDALCLSGRFSWVRLASKARTRGRSSGPVRTTPIAWLPRGDRVHYVERLPEPRSASAGLSSRTGRLLSALLEVGASFASELGARAGLLPTETETALGELVTAGLVSSDGPAGLRALIRPSKEKHRAPHRRRSGAAAHSFETAGRWSLVRPTSPSSTAEQNAAEYWARVLLRRYGVLGRRVLEREACGVPWRDLLRVFRRLEARGEVRGGRFVAGLTGEQYALPEAVTLLRAVRKRPHTGELVLLAGADPLNLSGVVTPGERVPAQLGARVLYRDGAPIGFKSGAELLLDAAVEPALVARARRALTLGRVTPEEAKRPPAVGRVGRSA